jgi:ADP-heptose:LPS heptosyltransferase
MSNVIRNYTSPGSEAHISLHMSKFAEELIEALGSNSKNSEEKRQNFHHNTFYSTQDSFIKARSFVEKLHIKSHAKKVFLNPDTSCSYTRIPVDLQKAVLKAILLNPNTHVLLNCGFTFQGIEKELLDEVPSGCGDRVTVIPKDTPIDVYAALTDHSDVFITGDTAPLHIAASKKIIVDSDLKYQNSTAVVGIFGATSSKIYGYDSFSEDHIAAPQKAPSKVFEVSPECKNLTCIDKIFKACPQVKCFDGLRSEPIIEYVNGYLL